MMPDAAAEAQISSMNSKPLGRERRLGDPKVHEKHFLALADAAEEAQISTAFSRPLG